MRIPAIALLAVLSGCGPMQLAGNWTVSIVPPGYQPCTGTMGIAETNQRLGGTLACAAPATGGGTLTLQGNVVGALAGDSVSLTWTPQGYEQALLTATASDDRHMSGVVNGSGISNGTFTANRF